MPASRGPSGAALTRQDAKRLRSALHRTTDARVFKRALALCLLAEGEGWAEASRVSTLSRGAISSWLRRYLRARTLAALQDAPRSGRPPQLRFPPSRLGRLLDSDPHRLGYSTHTWTAPLLAFHLQEHYDQRLTARTLRRRLHALGWRWKRPKYVFARKAPHLPQKKGRSFAN